jgi:hypothetical protein
MTKSRRVRVGDASLTSGSAFGLELIDEIDRGEEAPARSRPDAASRDRDRQMRLAGSGSTDHDNIALLGAEGAASEVAREVLR